VFARFESGNSQLNKILNLINNQRRFKMSQEKKNIGELLEIGQKVRQVLYNTKELDEEFRSFINNLILNKFENNFVVLRESFSPVISCIYTETTPVPIEIEGISFLFSGNVIVDRSICADFHLGITYSRKLGRKEVSLEKEYASSCLDSVITVGENFFYFISGGDGKSVCRFDFSGARKFIPIKNFFINLLSVYHRVISFR